MRQINVYVEGKGDLIFISHFLSKRFNLLFQYDFIKLKSNCSSENCNIQIHTFFPTSGQGGINSKAIKDLLANIQLADIPLGVESVIVLDADTEKHRDPVGGFKSRNAYIQELTLDIPIRYFLVPNHMEDGNLESLLHTIISKKGVNFYRCLSSYVECLSAMDEDVPKGIQEIPCFHKTKLEWYTYIMLGKDGAKNNNNNRDYLSSDLWDLETPHLDSLKAFFDRIISPR